MPNKKNDILDKAEDVILRKIGQYTEHVHEMDDKDCHALQLLVMTEGRILAIRNGNDNQMPF